MMGADPLLQVVVIVPVLDLFAAGHGKIPDDARKLLRSWSEQVLPYGLVVTIAPSRWTLTEASREIRLPPSPASGTAV